MFDNSQEQNILDTKPSGNQTERIELLAKALAYGALENLWSPLFRIQTGRIGEEWAAIGKMEYEKNLATYLTTVWEQDHPHKAYLMAFGYLEKDMNTLSPDTYLLTEKAFLLLSRPASPPSLFVSYKRSDSSAFGLLVVARLQAVGIQNPFIDMNIDPGDEWHARLEKVVRGSEYFISLIGKDTLSSPYVIKEIEWAMDTPDIIFIPVWHGGFSGYDGQNLPSEVSNFLGSKNAIRIKEESAEEYNNAIVRLLNHFGYAP